MPGSELLSLWILSRHAVMSGGLCRWRCLWCFCLGMKAALSSASTGIPASSSMESCGHLPLALITMLVVLSWLWPAVTLAEPSPCHRDSIVLPNGRAEGFSARGWLGAVHGLRLGCQLPRQSLSNGHMKGW